MFVVRSLRWWLVDEHRVVDIIQFRQTHTTDNQRNKLDA